MRKTSPPFRQRDLTRAYRAIEAAGGHVARVEIDKGGKIILVPTRVDERAAASGK
jgi:hypothetical protein